MPKPWPSNSVSGIRRFIPILMSKRPGGTPPSSVATAKTGGSGDLPAQDLVHLDALGLEGLAQHRDAGVRAGAAAHEHVESGIAGIGPRVDRDMALRQHRHPGHSVRLEVV